MNRSINIQDFTKLISPQGEIVSESAWEALTERLDPQEENLRAEPVESSLPTD